jgi:hypothetical protein
VGNVDYNAVDVKGLLAATLGVTFEQLKPVSFSLQAGFSPPGATVWLIRHRDWPESREAVVIGVNSECTEMTLPEGIRPAELKMLLVDRPLIDRTARAGEAQPRLEERFCAAAGGTLKAVVGLDLRVEARLSGTGIRTVFHEGIEFLVRSVSEFKLGGRILWRVTEVGISPDSGHILAVTAGESYIQFPYEARDVSIE